MLVLEKVFVNPDFSTSPVQAVLASHLYLGAGTPAGVVPGSMAGSSNNQAVGAKIRYNAGRSARNAKREPEATRAPFRALS